MRPSSCLIAPSLLALAAAVCAADGAPVTKTVKLTATPLPLVNAVMTSTVPAGANRGQFVEPMVTKNGVILASQGATFSKGQTEQSVSIGSQSLMFSVNTDSQTFAIKPEKGAPVMLKPQGDGLAPLVLPGADKRKIAVSFPVASASKFQSLITMRASTAAKGSLDGEAILFLDDNLDGVWNTQDAFTIGASPCFAPMTKRLATKKGVYTLDELGADGSKAVFTPETGDTIACTAKFTGESAGHAVFTSADGSLATVVTGAGDQVRLPVGDYKLQYGAVYSKAGKVMAVIMPGSLPAFTIASNGADDKKAKAPVLAYGGPFILRFTSRFDSSKNKISVDPSISLYGAGGEQYRDFRWQGTPTIYVNGKQNGSMGFG